ncbi:MAG TPA: hypothetical protein VGO50_06260 [Pyrinomonadaceae bacterium]|jgi:hypothetical protein|nr:hypothetical protein [Pyrinomonadaceae bacterium]
MTKSEELVYKLCTKSFLSLWSYANPKGKKGKELCDILVVCEPDIIIFSVKEVELKETGDKVGYDRWRKAAVEESCQQIFGAERWINSSQQIVKKDGELGLFFPDPSVRRIHRVAVALGSKGKVPAASKHYEKGFVHVLNEHSLDALLKELDTISDFAQYLNEKEKFFTNGRALTLFDGSGEEDLLAFYISNENRFPEQVTMLVIDTDLWIGFKKLPEVKAKKKLDVISYFWDELIEELYQTYLSSNIIFDEDFATELTEIEKAVRVLARENRMGRRMLSIALTDFLQNSKKGEYKARIVTDASSRSDTIYVFQLSNYDSNRKANRNRLNLRCVVARGLVPDKRKVLGIIVEVSEKVKGTATGLFLLDIGEWTREWQEKMEMIQKETGYFENWNPKSFSEDEYPQI